MVVERFGVYLVPLEPTVGSEMSKTRPCVVVSPEEMNDEVRTIIVAPLTSTRRKFPFRVNCTFAGRDGQVAIDHLRSVDKMRLHKRLGKLNDATAIDVLDMLKEIFS